MNISFEIMGKTYDVDYEIETAQQGGMIDPSWDAYVSEYDVSYKGKSLPRNKFNDLIYDLIGAELEKA
jgi:hypothetical protein